MCPIGNATSSRFVISFLSFPELKHIYIRASLNGPLLEYICTFEGGQKQKMNNKDHLSPPNAGNLAELTFNFVIVRNLVGLSNQCTLRVFIVNTSYYNPPFLLVMCIFFTYNSGVKNDFFLLNLEQKSKYCWNSTSNA